MKQLVLLISFISVLLILNSCEGAYDFDTENLSTHVELTSDIAIPLIDATITLEEIMPESDDVESFLVIDSENYMTLKYKFDVTNVTIEEFLGEGEPLSGPILPDIDYRIDPQNVNIGLDKFLKEGSITIADPRIKLSIKNYWDVPVQFKLQDFYYYEDEAGTIKHPVTGSVVDNWQIVVLPPSPGDFATTEISLNKTTSNIDVVISSLPHHLSFGALFQTITTPPTAYNVPAGTTDSIKMDLEIPLDIGMENIVMQDTIEFSFGEDTTLIEELTIGTIIDNGLPLSLNIQFNFIDEDGNVLASLFDGGLDIAGGTVDANGKITSSTESRNVSETDKTTIRNLLKASNIVYKVTINSTDIASGKTVKLYSNYSIGIKMGAKFKINPGL